MESSKIKLFDGYYVYKGATSRELEILSVFLTDDVEAGDDTFDIGFRSWSENDKFKTLESNATVLEKIDDYIVLSDKFDLWDDCSEFFDGGKVSLSLEEFLAILDAWKAAWKKGSDEIILSRVDGLIKIEASV